MDQTRHAALKQVSATFAEWKGAQEEVNSLDQTLQAELLRHAKGQVPFPDELYTRLQEQKEKADQLFSAATEALQSIPSRY